MSTKVQDIRVVQSYGIIDSLRLDHGLYLASPSTDYSFVWLRDSFYISLPYLDKPCDTYERTYWRFLDLFKEYEWKLDYHIQRKPIHQYEYIHARYSAHDVKEIHTEWGHSQNDAVGAILWGIGAGIKRGKKILRDEKDKEILQKLVDYVVTLEYWNDADSGMWEENREVRSSSIGACVAGLSNVEGIVNVPYYEIENGYMALSEKFPTETSTRENDLAQLSLIYPYNLFTDDTARELIERIEENLLRDRGVIRYKGDSYYSTLEAEHGRGLSRKFYEGTEAEWCFGFCFLALAHAQVGNMEKARYYVERTEQVMLADGSVPELYYSKTDRYNVNTPLGWSNAMYILAKEKIEG